MKTTSVLHDSPIKNVLNGIKDAIFLPFAGLEAGLDLLIAGASPWSAKNNFLQVPGFLSGMQMERDVTTLFAKLGGKEGTMYRLTGSGGAAVTISKDGLDIRVSGKVSEQAPPLDFNIYRDTGRLLFYLDGLDPLQKTRIVYRTSRKELVGDARALVDKALELGDGKR